MPNKHPLLTIASSAGVVLVILTASALWRAGSGNPAAQAADTAVVLTEAEAELDYEAHAAALREEWGEGHTVIIEKPFVVVGNEPAKTVQRRAEGTVRWAVTKLKDAYFKKDPDHIITVYLFKDKKTYEAGAKRLSGREPGTPYGYYSRTNAYMVMNIATGGGTLVHEIVHPFVAANFPKCPAWFNEGLGSLYEQSAERDGQIVGRTNWRLAGLQKAIKAGTLPTFKELTSTTDAEFYGEGSGTHYAMARYLCYYLQQQGKLHQYYHAFHEKQEDDPTGFETLRTILGAEGTDIDKFQRNWQRWVMRLRFPEA